MSTLNRKNERSTTMRYKINSLNAANTQTLTSMTNNTREEQNMLVAHRNRVHRPFANKEALERSVSMSGNTQPNTPTEICG